MIKMQIVYFTMWILQTSWALQYENQPIEIQRAQRHESSNKNDFVINWYLIVRMLQIRIALCHLNTWAVSQSVQSV